MAASGSLEGALSVGEGEGEVDGLGDGVVVELAEDGAGDGVGVAFTTSVGGGDTFRLTTGLGVATLGLGVALTATFWLERREILTGFSVGSGSSFFSGESGTNNNKPWMPNAKASMGRNSALSAGGVFFASEEVGLSSKVVMARAFGRVSMWKGEGAVALIGFVRNDRSHSAIISRQGKELFQ
jgi:hypothetical protein